MRVHNFHSLPPSTQPSIVPFKPHRIGTLTPPNPTRYEVQVNMEHMESPVDLVPKTATEFEDNASDLLSIKEVACRYGLKKGALYHFIKTDPMFPYINLGVKKKFFIDTKGFEAWMKDRTKKQKHAHFSIPTVVDLTKLFKGAA